MAASRSWHARTVTDGAPLAQPALFGAPETSPARGTAYIAPVMGTVLDITDRLRPRAAEPPPDGPLATVHALGMRCATDPRTIVTLTATNALGLEDGSTYLALARGDDTARICLSDADLAQLEADIPRMRAIARRRRTGAVRLVWASRRGEVAQSSPDVEGEIVATNRGFVNVRANGMDLGWFSLDTGEPTERKDRRKPYLRLDAADLTHLRTTTAAAATAHTRGGSTE